MPCAIASGCPPGHEKNDSCTDEKDGGVVSATATSGATSTSEATAGATATSTSSSGGNSQSVNITETAPSRVTVRNVASPDTPNPYPTAPCRIGVSAGLSLAGGALSGGSSVEDRECTLRETARSFKDLGVPEMGLHLLCTQSTIILGERDKKGNLPKGAPTPIGADQCFQLVRRFQRDSDDVDAAGSAEVELRRELEILRDTIDQYSLGQRELESAIADVRKRSAARPPSPAQATERVIREEFLDDKKRAALAQLLSDREDERE